MNEGRASSAFNKIYSGPLLTATKNTSDSSNPVVSGKTYTFYLVAVNSINSSLESPHVQFGVGIIAPSTPSLAPSRDNQLTTKNKIAVRWGASTTSSLPILGYELHRNGGNGSP